MSLSKAFSHLSKSGCLRNLLISSRPTPVVGSAAAQRFHSLREPFVQVSSLHRSTLNATRLQGSWFSSAASSENTEKETEQSGDGHEAVGGKSKTSRDSKTAKVNEDGMDEEGKEATDTEQDEDLTFDDLVRIATEKDELLKKKTAEFEAMRDKFLRSYAEIENVMERTKREAENAKKFAVQKFATTLLDVADNLGRASSVVKVSFSKIDASGDTAGAVPLLKTLLEGVEMTEKQLSEAFRKFGVEKYDPINEQFDPHRHNAVYQIPDDSKPVGTVANVIKPGYTLHDRIIRPAEVGVTQALNNEAE